MTPADFAEIFTSPQIKPGKYLTEEEAYQQFVESMVPFCHCAEQYRPCDGVLAGGLCDHMGIAPDPEDDAGWVDWEDDEI